MNTKTKKNKTSWEIIKTIRNDWGQISPVTKVIPNKKKNLKIKHKKGFDKYDY